MKFWQSIGWVALLGVATGPAHAKVRAVAATDTLAWATRAIGGNLVQVDALSRGDQDPHTIEARPSQVVKLVQADMVVRIGMDLDLWLDPLLDAARNSKISRGGKGYVDAHVGLRPLEVPSGKLDPSMGDIHVYGNPHYEYDPVVMRDVIARNILQGFLRVDPGNASTYRGNYSALSGRLTQSLAQWEAKMRPFRGKAIVTYHKTFPYLLERFGLRELDNVEPKPGIEPSAGHVADVAREMKQDGVKVILTESYRSKRFSDLLARQSGGVVVPIPAGVGGERGANDYFSAMDMIVNRLAGALG
jgi:zinc/manganese transport system substrate-binding protein